MNHVIIGYGEVGKGLAEVLKPLNPRLHDPILGYFTIKMDDVDVIHITIPGNLNNFKQLVHNYILEFNPGIIVIHSTVPIGTTKDIQEQHPDLGVLHSPIRGKHPEMVKGIRTYRKHVSGYSEQAIDTIIGEFTKCGIKCAPCLGDPSTTELGKILELFRYGKLIQMATEMKDVCDYFNLDYRKTVSEFIQTYNDGLYELGLDYFNQADCKPMIGNRLGGHCVIENCWELFKQLPDTMGINDSLDSLLGFGMGDRRLI